MRRSPAVERALRSRTLMAVERKMGIRAADHVLACDPTERRCSSPGTLLLAIALAVAVAVVDSAHPSLLPFSLT